MPASARTGGRADGRDGGTSAAVGEIGQADRGAGGGRVHAADDAGPGRYGVGVTALQVIVPP